MSRLRQHIAWACGAMLGAAVAAVALGAARPAPVAATPSASLRIDAHSTGELKVERPGPVLRVTDIGLERAGATGSTTVVNQTARTLRVRVRIQPTTADLDALVDIAVHAGSQTLSAGPLSSAPAWSRESIVLRPLERQVLRVTARRRLDVRADQFAGREADAHLQLRAKVAA